MPAAAAAPAPVGPRRSRTAGVLLCAAGACLTVTGTLLAWPAPDARSASTSVAQAAPASSAAPASAAGPAPAAPAARPSPVTITAPARAARPATGRTPLPAAKGVRAARPAVVDAEAAPPERVVIPRIGVDSRLVGLRLQRDRTLEVPADYDQAGWYRQGTKPGDTGPAVLVGHVDSYDGPAVFFRLSELQRGDRIAVHRTDGTRVLFAVQAKERVAKDAFPTARVYGDTAGAELRLLTCGGRFDEQTKHYQDNVVVYAKQVRA